MFYLRHLKSVRSGKTPFLLKSVLSLTILLLTVVVLQSMLKLRSQASRLKSDTCESSDFRQQYLPPGIYEQLLRMAQTGVQQIPFCSGFQTESQLPHYQSAEILQKGFLIC